LKLTASYPFPTKRATLAQVATAGAKSSTSPTPPPVTRLARSLALAYLVERLLDSGEIKNYAAAARRLEISKARMAAIAALWWLPVTVQEAILDGRMKSERGFQGVDGGAAAQVILMDLPLAQVPPLVAPLQ
jgi:hypothetical protein